MNFDGVLSFLEESATNPVDANAKYVKGLPEDEQNAALAKLIFQKVFGRAPDLKKSQEDGEKVAYFIIAVEETRKHLN